MPKSKITQIWVVIISGLIISCSPQQNEGLTGTWIGEYSYTNVNGIISEEVEVEQDKDFYIKAKKITGDDCVPAGNLTLKKELLCP